MKKNILFLLNFGLYTTLFCLDHHQNHQEYTMDKTLSRSVLRTMHCVPCEGGVAPLTLAQIQEYLAEFSDWKLLTNPYKIERVFTFKNFIEAMKFVNAVADAAEFEGHHPDITIVYNKVTMQLFTHAIQGLSTNDFIMAGVIDELLQD